MSRPLRTGFLGGSRGVMGAGVETDRERVPSSKHTRHSSGDIGYNGRPDPRLVPPPRPPLYTPSDPILYPHRRFPLDPRPVPPPRPLSYTIPHPRSISPRPPSYLYSPRPSSSTFPQTPTLYAHGVPPRTPVGDFTPDRDDGGVAGVYDGVWGVIMKYKTAQPLPKKKLVQRPFRHKSEDGRSIKIVHTREIIRHVNIRVHFSGSRRLVRAPQVTCVTNSLVQTLEACYVFAG